MYFDTQVGTNGINEYIPPLTQILKKCNPAEVNISVTAAPYHCIIGAKRLVDDCNGGNHTGAYSHIYICDPYIVTPGHYSGEPIRVTNP